jgi:hypothetical protein
MLVYVAAVTGLGKRDRYPEGCLAPLVLNCAGVVQYRPFRPRSTVRLLSWGGEIYAGFNALSVEEIAGREE